MITIRKANERGHFDHGWLDTHHTFSFSRYYDPDHMGFRALRVINDDRVAPGAGFGMHGHNDMEIITYVLDGALAHKDSLGTAETIEAGEFQRMTAGTGIRHSEFNPSADTPVHLYQIWIEPDRDGHTPSYEQKRFDDGRADNRLGLVASPDGRDGSLTINQDARLYLGRLQAGQEVHQPLDPSRHAWLQVLRGSVEVDGQLLETGDGVAISGETVAGLRAVTGSELLLFDLN